MQRITYSLRAFFMLFAAVLATSLLAQDGDFRATAPEPGPAPEIKLGDFQDFELDNGLQVVLVENHKLPRVNYQLFVDVPPHLEGEYAGAQSLLGSMLRRSTSEMSKEEIDEAIDFIGASLNTSGSGAFASTISKYKEDVLSLMAEVILDARFPQEEFDKVKEDTKASLAQQISTPGSIASRVRQAVTYGLNHPYGEQMTETTLGNIDLEVVKSVYDKYFVPNRSYLVMVGDLTREEAENLAGKYFSEWEAKEVAVPEFPTPEPPEGVTVNFVPRAGAVQSNVLISHPIELQPGTKEAIRASLMNTALGSGFNGRLFANLREDKGYTYGAYSSVNNDPLVANFRANADVRNEVTDSAVAQFMYELERITAEPLEPLELDRAKNQITGSFGRALESPQRIANFALNTVRYDLDRDFYPEYLQVMQNSSLNDVFEVTKEVVTPNNTHIIVVGDKAVAETLAPFATDGKVRYYDVNGEPIDMEASALPSDLTADAVINNYIEAIGGKEAIDQIKSYNMVMEASVQGQTITQSMVKAGGDRLSSQTSMGGMVLADQRYNKGAGMMQQQGQSMPMNDEILVGLKEQAALFPVADLSARMDAVELEGTEMIDGKPTVVLKVDDGKSTHYFDQETGLQVRMVQKQGPATITFDLGDYQEVNGVLFPYSLDMTGVAPFPIEMKVTSMEVNTEIDEAVFSVE